jgi:hypothetical protein
VQKVWTADGNNNAKSSFVPGDVIRYDAQVTNSGSSAVAATATFLATGPQQVFQWSGPANVTPGTDFFYSPSTVPTNASAGTYTLTVTFANNGVSSQSTSQFTVTSSLAAPSNLSLVMDSGGAGINVSWTDNSNNEAGFDISYSPTQDAGTAKHLRVGPQNSLSSDWGLTYNNNGLLVSGQVMCFQVTAFNSTGTSAPTPWGCITVP